MKCGSCNETIESFDAVVTTAGDKPVTAVVCPRCQTVQGVLLATAYADDR